MSPVYGSVEFAPAADGTLVYVPVTIRGLDRRIVLVDREGNNEAQSAFERAGHLRLSPAGDQIVVNTRGANDDLWIYDLSRGSQRRLTAGWDNYGPIWSPDGTQVTFISNRDGNASIYSLAADGSGELERLTANGLRGWIRAHTGWSSTSMTPAKAPLSSVTVIGGGNSLPPAACGS